MLHYKERGAYTVGSAEWNDNVAEIWFYLSSIDPTWTKEAVAGVCGNFQAESGMNPWRWQAGADGRDVILASTDNLSVQAGHAYGFGQYDPPGNYINNSWAQGRPGYGPNFSDRPGSPRDGYAQLDFLNRNIPAQYFATKAYPLSFAQYKASHETPEYLAHAWFSNWERGTWSETRTYTARTAYNLLLTLDGRKRFPIWLLFKCKERMKL